MAAISQWMLAIRYLLLPYYYTLFYKASRPVTSTPSATVTRPLFFEFPDDLNTHYIDSQFMVGDGLLISPIMEEGKKLLDTTLSIVSSLIQDQHQEKLISQGVDGIVCLWEQRWCHQLRELP